VDEFERRTEEARASGALEGVVSLLVFGSHARGGAHRESDLDLAVLLDRSRFPSSRDRLAARITLAAELIRITGRNDVDLVVLNDAPPGLGRAILEEGRLLWTTDEEAHFAFALDVRLRAADLDPFLRRMQRLKLEALSP
jgi:uncharacterized protein